MQASLHFGDRMIKKFANDFKEFAFKGNLIDMAVGIVIGGAFGTVVKSLVDDVFMPVVGRLTGGVNFKDYYVVLKGEVPAGTALEAAKKIDGVNLLTYGNFVTSFISFLILAFVLFLVINKFMAALKKKEAEPAAPPAPSDEVVLLTEIRDLLKNQKP
jgi:large conductance mechanosensitive channel